MTGYGIRRWKDGSSYAGDWVEGEKEGVGEYTCADGSKYEGQFHLNRFHGSGKWLEPDGTEFEGTFVQHKRQGQGIEKGWDGSSFEGDWADGKRGGFGKWTSATGAVYEGTWKDGKRHGSGTFECSGYTYEGTFEAGRPTMSAGTIVLKTARNDTDDFEPNEVDFMNPVAPSRLCVDATAFNPEADVLQGWVPLDHLVCYFKKPALSEHNNTKAAAAQGAVPRGDVADEPVEEEVDLNADYVSAALPVHGSSFESEPKGVEAGRDLKLTLHRWGLPAAATAEERDPAEGDQPSGEPRVRSPRQLGRLVQRGIHKELELFDHEVVKSDMQGFATAKNLLVYGGKGAPSELVLLCSDGSCADIEEVMGLSQALQLRVDVLKEVPIDTGGEK
eukprot:TRINITY_DN28947_c0_g1_i1.p1 TRINITY_DN28947_c0_g1~~TRINITY_DN28947_c0_g1_i1.p1  ORF type:complete len:389 (-),score=101.62 TRINITY_DN28947_c0_g1_i1:225-1391(-)